PDGRDELPRPLRNASLYDDLWGPFCRVALSLGICYALAALAANAQQLPETLSKPLGVGLAIVGTIFFPVVLLITTTSGTLLNLRPDRVMRTLLACGTHYLFALMGWILCGGLYTWLIFGRRLVNDA